eukprot:UN07676
MAAGLFFDNPKVVQQSRIRSAIGYVIPLNNQSHSKLRLNTNRLLQELQIENARIRLFPRGKYVVAFYPFFGFAAKLCYMFGAMRVYPAAGKEGFFKCPPMEIYEGHGTVWNAKTDNVITYLFAQNHIDKYAVDEDMKRDTDGNHEM